MEILDTSQRLNTKFVGKEKFPQKLLMWIAVSDRDMSEPLFCTSTAVAINTSICINECLEKRYPFIHKYHGDFNYLFWPDLASSHYPKGSLNWMDKYVSYVDKESNPPNLPQARPIKLKRFSREVGKLQQSKPRLIASN